MKKINLFVVILSLAFAVACGDKDKKSKSSAFPVYNQYQQGVMAPASVEGTVNAYTGLVSVGGYNFQAPQQMNQQSLQFLTQFYQQTQGSNQTYRAMITGYILQSGGGVQQGGYYPQQPQMQNGTVLVITAPIQAL